MNEIQLKDAKATLSAVVDEAMRGAPSIITRHGRREAVLLSYDDWLTLSTVPSFAKLLLSAPLDDGDLPGRDLSPPRPIEF
jgi:antitoxin Phd